jgi:hypothetical protein
LVVGSKKVFYADATGNPVPDSSGILVRDGPAAVTEQIKRTTQIAIAVE